MKVLPLGPRFAVLVLLCCVCLPVLAQQHVAPPTVTTSFGSPTVALTAPANFAGRGSVSGTVFDDLHHPVADAAVTLTSGSVFGGGGTAVTDSQGHYSFPGVAVGVFHVNASFSPLRAAGETGGQLQTAGEGVVSDLMLGPSATLKGRVVDANGTMPVPNAQVNLSNGLSVTADQFGSFSLDFVPLGNHSLRTTDPTGAHHGTSTVTLSAQDEIQTVDVALNKARLARTTTLTFQVANPNPAAPLTGISFTDSLPEGLLVASPNQSSGDCTGALDAVAGSPSISVSGLALAAGGSCSISVKVTGIRAGKHANSTSPIAAKESGTGTTSNIAILVVVAPPSIVKSFSAASMGLNTSVTLTFTITNPNGATDLTGVSFNDTLPSGLIIANPDSLVGTCDPGVITPAVTSINLVGGTILAGSSCTFSIDVLAISGGTQVNTTDPVTSNEGGTGNTATASVDVVLPDLTVTKTHTGNFTQAQVGATYTITVTNSGGATTNAAVTVTDMLPAGLTATAIGGSGWTCPTLTSCNRVDGLDPGLSFPDITLTVNVAVNAAATVTNTVTVSGGGEANTSNDTATDPTTVTALPPGTLSITPVAANSVTITQGSSATLAFNVTSGSAGLGAIFFNCVGLPTGATCNFDNQGITTSPSTVTVTIRTIGNATASQQPLSLWKVFPVVAVVLFPLLGLAGRGDRRKKRKSRLKATVLLSCMALLLAFAGCAGSFHNIGGVAPGVYPLTVTATSSTNPPVQASTVVTLTVK